MGMVPDIFATLGSAVRRGMLRQTASAPRFVSDLAREHGVSQPTMSRHVQELAKADLVSLDRDGQVTLVRAKVLELERALRDLVREVHPFGLDQVVFLIDSTGEEVRTWK